VSEPLLVTRDLCCEFRTDTARVRAVDHLDLSIERGRIVGLVGESGCGKSATALALMGLLPTPAGRVTAGSIRLDGRELTTLSEVERRKVRGNQIAMIFQDPMTCLNPYLTVEEQLCEVPELHQGSSRQEARRKSVELLRQVGIADAERRMRDYPHQLSGGMRQRVMIAMALLCDPDVLVADEPTTALDVTIQAQILALLLELRRARGLAILLITHDLAVVASTCDRVVVMYAGRAVETGPARDVLRAPAHPYTRALLRSVPRADRHRRADLASIAGLPPRLDQGGFDACSFAPRCEHVRDVCRQGEPALVTLGPGRERRCVVPTSDLDAEEPAKERDGARQERRDG